MVIKVVDKFSIEGETITLKPGILLGKPAILHESIYATFSSTLTKVGNSKEKWFL